MKSKDIMKQAIILLMIGAFFAMAAAGCRKAPSPPADAAKADDQTGKDTHKPAPADDGKVVGPITVKFVGFVDRARGPRGAKFEVRNSSGKPLSMVSMTLRYLDAEGKQIRTFPWAIQVDPVWLQPGETTTEIMGTGIPANCASVDIVVREHK